jgi:hypothetical protein
MRSTYLFLIPLIDAFNGAVYVYSIITGEWILETIIYSPDSLNSNFGVRVEIDGDNLMISANGQSKLLILYLHQPVVLICYDLHLKTVTLAEFIFTL